jgi:ubiquinone/menaquinone biosynthesis C-methylase UbiE
MSTNSKKANERKNKMNVFDRIAQHYDSEKQQALAQQILTALNKEVGDCSEKVILDYGCGTGLIGLELAAACKKMILMDPSVEMMNIVNDKMQHAGLTNTQTITGSFSAEETPEIQADIIIVSLVLLHVPDTQNLLSHLYAALKNQGEVFIVDFDKNEHVQHEKVHNGFDQKELARKCELAGFKQVTSHTFYQGEALFMNQAASLFILKAQK